MSGRVILVGLVGYPVHLQNNSGRLLYHKPPPERPGIPYLQPVIWVFAHQASKGHNGFRRINASRYETFKACNDEGGYDQS